MRTILIHFAQNVALNREFWNFANHPAHIMLQFVVLIVVDGLNGLKNLKA